MPTMNIRQKMFYYFLQIKIDLVIKYIKMETADKIVSSAGCKICYILIWHYYML